MTTSSSWPAQLSLSLSDKINYFMLGNLTAIFRNNRQENLWNHVYDFEAIVASWIALSFEKIFLLARNRGNIYNHNIPTRGFLLKKIIYSATVPMFIKIADITISKV